MSDWQTALEQALDAFAADAGSLHLLDDAGETLFLAASVGMPEELIPTIERIPVGKGMAGLAAERDAPVDSCNIQVDDSGAVRPGARVTALRGAIAAPMRRADGRVAGVLGIGARGERQWTPDEIARLLALGAALADQPSRPSLTKKA